MTSPTARLCAFYGRLKLLVIFMYRWMYYGPLRCAAAFRINKYLFACKLEKLIVCERLRLIYQPIPKTGCTTVKSLLLEAEGYSVPDDDEAVHQGYPRGKLRYPQGKLNAKVLQSSDYLKFAFVRNPWARLVSCYCDKVLKPRPGIFHSFAFCYPYVGFARMSFADFVRFVCRVPDDLCEPHFMPQSAFFDAGEVDFVGRFERFSDDLAQVIERAGLSDDLRKWCNVRRMGSSNDRHYTDFYDAKTRRLVAEKFKADIEQFDYRFGD